MDVLIRSPKTLPFTRICRRLPGNEDERAHTPARGSILSGTSSAQISRLSSVPALDDAHACISQRWGEATPACFPSPPKAVLKSLNKSALAASPGLWLKPGSVPGSRLSVSLLQRSFDVGAAFMAATLRLAFTIAVTDLDKQSAAIQVSVSSRHLLPSATHPSICSPPSPPLIKRR